MARGDLPGNDVELQQALAAAERLGSAEEIAMAHANLGRYRVYGNEPSAGLRYLSESLERVVPMRHKAGMAYVFDAIAEAAAQLGAHERSVYLFAAAHAIRDAIGAPPVPSLQERMP